MSRLWRALRSADEGMSTAEYCIGTVAACALAAVLFKILSGNLVKDLVEGLIKHAFSLIPF
ncbi:MAG TPA: DUF4244 domain-containing protein [Mycobacteriales bacterium]|jgi:hypothetical protein|nr:DUF4244 domain-containing protein [Mycobacteriales bacterium]